MLWQVHLFRKITKSVCSATQQHILTIVYQNISFLSTSQVSANLERCHSFENIASEAHPKTVSLIVSIKWLHVIYTFILEEVCAIFCGQATCGMMPLRQFFTKDLFFRKLFILANVLIFIFSAILTVNVSGTTCYDTTINV